MGYRLKRFLSDDVDHWPLGPEKKLFTTEPQRDERKVVKSFSNRILTVICTP